MRARPQMGHCRCPRTSYSTNARDSPTSKHTGPRPTETTTGPPASVTREIVLKETIPVYPIAVRHSQTIMVVTREQALEKELRDITRALEKEKEAHTTTIQELGRTRLILQEVKRTSRAERADLELITLKCALLQQDAEGKAGKGAVHTDDKNLRGMLPDAPVHPPAKYGARSIPPPSAFDHSLPPHSGPDNHHGERSDRLGDDVAAGSTRGTKRTVDEMK